MNRLAAFQSPPHPCRTPLVPQEERFGGLLVELLRSPVVGLCVVLSLLATLASFAGFDSEALVVAEPVLAREPWRLLSATFLHGDVLHLAFNLYRTVVLGAPVERHLGSLRMLLLVLLLALGVEAAEYAVLNGGIGLSGVVYGLFGFAWMRRGEDEALRRVVEDRIVVLLLGWFVLCIALTVTGTYPVANVAHAAGLGLGVCIGRRWSVGATGLALAIALSVAARPWINLSDRRGDLFSHYAYLALEAERNEDGAAWARRAIELGADDAHTWYNLGLAHHRLAEYELALQAFERAHELDPDAVEPSTLEELRRYLEAR